MTVAAPARGGAIDIYGNFDMSGEIRVNADGEYNDRTLGYERPTTNNTARPAWNLELFSPRAEFRMYAKPAPPIEIYAKIFHSNDAFLGEAHTKIRYTKGRDDGERGAETLFYYRKGELGLGDPILNIGGGGFGTGLSSSGWLERGKWTLPKGRWSGEVNFLEFTDEGGNASGEKPEGITGKIRHEYKFHNKKAMAHEILYARKTFTDQSGVARQFNQVLGVDMTAYRDKTSFAVQYNFSSMSQRIHSSTPDNRDFGAYLRNLILLDRPKTGTVGFNTTYRHIGRNYTNFLGGGGEFLSFGEQIFNGVQTTAGDQVRRNWYSELYWDLPKYDASLVLRHEDKHGQNLFPGLRLSRRNEADLNMKLFQGLEARVLYSKTLFALENILLDYDQSRFIRDRNLHHRTLYGKLQMSRPWGFIRLDLKDLQRRSVNFKTLSTEASYAITKRIKIFGRAAKVWIDRPDLNWAITNVPSDLNSARPRISIVDAFFSRHAVFGQISYKPNDNSQMYLEYGSSGANDEGFYLPPGRRTDKRIYGKLEMWF